MRFETLRDALVGAVVALAALGLLEAGSYLLGTQPGRQDPLITVDHPEWSKSRAYDHLLFWRTKPDVETRQFSTNRFGLRGADVPERTGPEFRVLSLGESTTFGAFVGASETYSAVLESLVGEVNGKPLRVVNAGNAGYTIVQGYAYLRYRAQVFEADAVLLYFGYNDFLPVAHRQERDSNTAPGVDDWTLLEQRLRPASRLGAWLMRHSNLYRGMARLLRPAGAVTAGPLAEAERTERNRPRVPEERREQVLALIREVCAERGLHLTIVVPWYRDFSAHEELLRRFAAEHGVPLVDLPALLPGPEDRAAFFKDRVHPVAGGHRQIAEAIAEAAAPEWRRFDAARPVGRR